MKLTIFATIILVALSFSSEAYDFKSGNLCFNITSNSEPCTVEVTRGDSYSGLTAVEIPEKVKNGETSYSVTSIDSYAFSGCSGLTSVTFTEGSRLTSISENAFYNCYGLTSVTIPNSVTNIGSSAFAECYGLTSVTFMEGSRLTSIGSDAFYGCSGLTSVNIPESVTSIGSYAFAECYGLTSVTFTEGSRLTSIGSYAFSGCSGLTSVTIPNSVTSIGRQAFSGCSGLTSLTIGNSVTEIGGGAFVNSDNLTEITCTSIVPPFSRDEYGKVSNPFPENYEFYINAILTFPAESYNYYSRFEPWCYFITSDSLKVIYLTQNDTVTHSDTVFIFSSDTIHSIVHDTTYIVSKDTIYVIGSVAKTYNVTATTVNSKMGIGIGTGTYEENSLAELVAIANYGYHFTKWSDGNANNPRYEKITENCQFVAEFDLNNYSVLASSNNIAMGYVEGSDDYAYLSKPLLRAVPKYGYKFNGWSDGAIANPREVLVFCDTTFTALFMANNETDIENDEVDHVTIYATDNIIMVENANADVEVFDLTGRLVAHRVNSVSVQMPMAEQGIYIVKCGTEIKKVFVSQNR